MMRRWNPEVAFDKVDHSEWTDPATLDRSEVARLLSGYPELWHYWQTEMDSPNAYDKFNTGGIYRMHQPDFLLDVIDNYNAINNNEDPELDQETAELLTSYPEVQQARDAYLANPWHRVDQPEYYEVYFERWYIEKAIRHSEERREQLKQWEANGRPVSHEALAAETLLRALEAGTIETLTWRDYETGEVVEQITYDVPAKPSTRGAPNN